MYCSTDEPGRAVGWLADYHHIKPQQLEPYLEGLVYQDYLNYWDYIQTDVLLSCDVVVTAGGNTLLEAACAGTPAIVLYEDPHEREQGEALEAMGFGRCLGAGTGLDRAAIAKALELLDDPGERARLRARGRALVDGQGTARILDIVGALLDEAA